MNPEIILNLLFQDEIFFRFKVLNLIKYTLKNLLFKK